MNDIVINTNQFQLESQEQVYDLTVQQNKFELKAVADNEYQLNIIQQPFNLQITENVFQLNVEKTQFKVLELAPIVIYSGNFLNNRIETDFDFSDIAGGSKLIGNIAGKRVEKVALIINTPFDGNLQITIGDSVAQGRLMVIADNYPDSSNIYATEPNEYYTVATNLNIYFPSGNPTAGAGTAVIYFS